MQKCILKCTAYIIILLLCLHIFIFSKNFHNIYYVVTEVDMYIYIPAWMTWYTIEINHYYYYYKLQNLPTL